MKKAKIVIAAIAICIGVGVAFVTLNKKENMEQEKSLMKNFGGGYKTSEVK